MGDLDERQRLLHRVHGGRQAAVGRCGDGVRGGRVHGDGARTDEPQLIEEPLASVIVRRIDRVLGSDEQVAP